MFYVRLKKYQENLQGEPLVFFYIYKERERERERERENNGEEAGRDSFQAWHVVKCNSHAFTATPTNDISLHAFILGTGERISLKTSKPPQACTPSMHIYMFIFTKRD